MVKSISIECRKSTKCWCGIAKRWTVSISALPTASLVEPDFSPAKTSELHFRRTSAFSAGVKVEAKSSTISSAYLANPYKAWTNGRFAAGRSSVAR